jgi:hypothetical protein
MFGSIFIPEEYAPAETESCHCTDMAAATERKVRS